MNSAVWMRFVRDGVRPETAAILLGCTTEYAAAEMKRVEKREADRQARDEADHQLQSTWNKLRKR
ncbi:hypothetical protein CCAX7_54800 [Capsulimonas corticalis]|uniref:Uncharacterized protein n=1 Tax=Capsulimonas corticalis TaxID=2219043 RepID=A0A402D5Y0_9BACT|nr:hypothetical protein [Capsulimonas corticalis]BDI33429.1 hypothetical protein CCAX7_54800 [Capsulimonas corticalis]